MEAKASPRKPIVRILNKSSDVLIFDVACRSKLMRASVSDIPQPSSMTCIKVLPASFSINFMELAPASTAFSKSSLTAEAGR